MLFFDSILFIKLLAVLSVIRTDFLSEGVSSASDCHFWRCFFEISCSSPFFEISSRGATVLFRLLFLTAVNAKIASGKTDGGSNEPRMDVSRGEEGAPKLAQPIFPQMPTWDLR